MSDETEFAFYRRWYEKAYGYTLKGAKDIWTLEEYTLLMDAYYAGVSLVGKANSLVALCRRVPWAIDRKIWQIGTGYRFVRDTPSGRMLIPSLGTLIPRSGKGWRRENRILALATSPTGVANGAHKMQYLSAVLPRSEGAIARHIESLQKAALPSFFDDQHRGFSLRGADCNVQQTEEDTATQVYQVLVGMGVPCGQMSPEWEEESNRLKKELRGQQ